MSITGEIHKDCEINGSSSQMGEHSSEKFTKHNSRSCTAESIAWGQRVGNSCIMSVFLLKVSLFVNQLKLDQFWDASSIFHSEYSSNTAYHQRFFFMSAINDFHSGYYKRQSND